MDRKRILVFNVNWLGDVLFSTATIRNIRHNYPHSYIACIIPSRCYAVLKDNPNLDEIIIFEEKDRHRSLAEKIKFIRLLRAKKFDTVFLLHRSFTRALICFLAGIRERIGYYTGKRGILLTKKILPLPIDALHRIDYYLNIAEKAGLRPEDRYTEFFLSDKDREAAEDFLKKNAISDKDFIVGINAGGNWMPKRWPVKYWADLADRLIAEFGAEVIITGADKDLALAQEIRALMENSPFVACGTFNLKQLGALCRKLNLFITADTGPLHIANAVGAKKIIALFGPTDPKITGPFPVTNTVILQKNVGCKIPCYVVDCKDNRCMKAISVDGVIEQVRLIKR